MEYRSTGVCILESIYGCKENYNTGKEGVEEDHKEHELESDYITPIFDADSKTILIVEDNIELREYLSIILMEYSVVLKENGQKALEYLENYKVPDLIISVLMMPQIDGLELLNRLKSSDRFRHIYA